MTQIRRAITALSLSAAGLVGILGYEGYSEQAYIPVPGDVPTIGFGTTEGVKIGDTITPDRAVERAWRDIQEVETAIHQCVHVPLSQGENDAFTSFAYNVGSQAFCSSTLVKKLNAGDYKGACEELRRWVFVKGKKVQGLVNRREKEFRMCVGEETHEIKN